MNLFAGNNLRFSCLIGFVTQNIKNNKYIISMQQTVFFLKKFTLHGSAIND